MTSGEAVDRLAAALADRYTIERELGRGGMATVYLAQDHKHHRKVALKVLRPELAAALGPERFLREIEIDAQLNHPHIVPLHDSGQADGFLYYVMPYVEGESLRDRLAREKQLPIDEALQIAREVADGLAYAHGHGVVHRDIKPENILLESGHAVIADFGTARALNAARGQRLTEAGIAVGTPAYMSPEQGSAGDVDARSDVYSLACVVYEMLAGEPPFTGPSAQAVVAKRLISPAPRISILCEAVPAHVEQALAMALAKAPADRFATAAAFAEALVAAPTLRRSETVRSGPRPRRLAALMVAVLTVAAAVSVLLERGILRPSRSLGGGRRVTSVAVLPLVNLSGDSAQDYFATGMTEALITELGKVSALTPISRTSVMTYRGSHKPLPEIARELGVDDVVEGSVLREAGRVRMTARLIDGRTDRQLWTETYDREAANVLTLQAEVARTIADAIGATLTPAETRRLQVRRRVNPQAYDEYLLGRHQAALWTAIGFERAIAHYHRAIAIDSTFADPYAGLVDAYWWLTGDWGSMSPEQSTPLAKAAAEQAIALDSGSARAHAALAQVRSSLEWRWEEADGEFRRALALNPGLSDVHFWYSAFLTSMGRHDEAVREALRAVALDPLQPNLRTQLGWVYFYAGRFQESIVVEEEALELDPSFAAADMELGWNYSALGRHQVAIAAVGRALAGDPESQVALSAAATIYARAGRRAVARRFVDSLLALKKRGRWVDPCNVGQAYAFLGETDRALEYYNRAIEERSVAVGGLKVEWLPERFKADPRFHALLRRINME